MPLFGPPNVEKLKTRRDLKGLLAALKYQDSAAVRRAAALALAEMPHHLADSQLEQLVPPLLAALDDPEPTVLPAVALALGSIGQPAVLPLISALNNPKDRIRDGAARALGQLSKRLNEPAYLRLPIDSLVARLADPVAVVRRAAAWALGLLGARLDSAARGLPVEALIARLKDDAPEVREAAAAALGRLCEGRAISPLVRALEDPSASVRKVVAEALAELGWQPTNDQESTLLTIATQDWDRASQSDHTAILPLQRALQDPHADVRESAAIALGKINDPGAIAPLASALAENDPRVRRAILQSLDNLAAGPHAAQAIIQALRGANPDTRRTLLRSLSLTTSPAAIPALATALRSVETDLASTAGKVLGAMGAPAVSSLLDLLADPEQSVNERAENLLIQIGETALTPILTQLQNCPRPVCERLVRILGAIGSPRAVPQLIALLNDPLLASPTALALGQIGDRRALPHLTNLLSSDDTAVRQAATLALGNLGDPHSIHQMIELLHAGDRSTRQNAARALIQMVRSGKLDMQQKRLILSQSEIIAEKHADHQSHVDTVWPGANHRDEAYHLDTGIGLEPPTP